jgi:flagellar hook-length control protein FliK
MIMAGISFAAASAPAADGPSPQPTTSDKGHAFASALADAGQAPAKVATPKAPSDSKDKDRKAEKDDRQDDTGQTVPTAAGPAVASLAARDAKAPDGKAPDDKPAGKGASPRTVAATTGTSADAPDDAGPATIDTRETALDASQLTPVLDALKQVAAMAQQAPAETAKPAPLPEPPAAQAADPPPATASLLAARIVPAAAQVEAKPAAPAKKNARADAAIDKTIAIDATTATATVATDHHMSTTPDATAIAPPNAGRQLAAGGADRALDMAKQGAWLDGLSRDIAATGDSSSTLRFQAAPEHLGSVQVEIARGLEGVSVTLTASSESARSALADARPQLIADARAQGIHIANAQVDVSADSRPSNGGSQPEQRHDPRGQTGLSSQTGGDGGANGQSQTRSQPFAINQTSDSQPAAPAETEDPVAGGAPAGGQYA